jgi:hypothetical protein
MGRHRSGIEGDRGFQRGGAARERPLLPRRGIENRAGPAPGPPRTGEATASRAFERGDTYITERIGVAIAKRVWPDESPEWVAASEAQRVFEYQAKLFEKIDTTRRDETAAKNYLALCAANHREQDVFRASLVKAGENPDPPSP